MEAKVYDVVIVGVGLGGVAAALAVANQGLKALLTEETAWIGGQLTSQAVPPDEHPWIEEFGRTMGYHVLRKTLHCLYVISDDIRQDLPKNFNPGSGWVSAICARPDLWHQALELLLSPFVSNGTLTVCLHTIVSGGAQLSTPPSNVHGLPPKLVDDLVDSVALVNLETDEVTRVHATYFIDATELGDLLPLAGTEYRVGAEGIMDTLEPSAGNSRSSKNQQAFTWVFAMAEYPHPVEPIAKPAGYDRWRKLQPEFWPGPLFGLQDLDPITNQPRTPPLPLFSDDWRCWFKYRQIVDPANHLGHGLLPTTIVNWPQNDYFEGVIIDIDPELRWARLNESRELSASFLYYLQTECPRPDGQTGFSNLGLSSQYLGSADGFALTPYIRESRRIVARETITEADVAAEAFPGQKVSRTYPNSVGIGSYRIDLHPSTGGDAYIDLATLPFQIPLGAFIPVRTRNLIPACKNIGTTHITNGCYRLHPVEWNIGEVAGELAAFCIHFRTTPKDVYESPQQTRTFQERLIEKGVELEWPVEKM
jgi:hypothetical protein